MMYAPIVLNLLTEFMMMLIVRNVLVKDASGFTTARGNVMVSNQQQSCGK